MSMTGHACTGQGGITYSTCKNTCRANAGYGSADDKGDRVGSSTADGRANLEQKHTGDQDIADREKSKELSKGELHGAAGQEVGASIPPDVGERVELIGDLGNSLSRSALAIDDRY